METVYVVTMWSGGRAGKKWKTIERPSVLANGMGVSFISIDTRLSVQVIGNISVEEFEHGRDELAGELQPDTVVETEAPDKGKSKEIVI